MIKTNNNIVSFETIKKQHEARQALLERARRAQEKQHNVGICRIIYKDIVINFWHKNDSYTCNVERGN